MDANDKLWNVLTRLLDRFVPEPSQDPEEKTDPRQLWRERAFFTVFLLTAVLGFAAYAASVTIFILEANWTIVCIFTASYLLIIYLVLNRRLPYRLRAGLGVLLLFLVGASSLWAVGPFGTGKTILLFAAVLACIVLSAYHGLAIMALSGAVLTVFYFFLPQRLPHWQGMLNNYSIQLGWQITGLVLMVVGFLSVLALAVVIRGLYGNLTKAHGLEAALRADISRREMVEQALSQSEAKYRTLVEHTTDLVSRFDRDCRFLYVNTVIRRVSGLEPGDFLGKTMRDLGYPEEDCFFWEQAIGEVFATGQPKNAEFKFAAGEQLLEVDWRLFPERDEDGNVTSVMTVARDITEQRRTQEEYRTLFSEMLDGLALHRIILDESERPVDYRFLAVNPAFERMMGLRARDLVGKRITEVFPGIEPFWIDTYGQVAITGQPASFEHYAETLEKHFEVVAFSTGRHLFASIMRDVTDRKRAEAEKALLENQLRQAQKMEALGTLAGGIAHDFNNILTAIIGYAELALTDLKDPQAAGGELEQVIAYSERARDLVKRILTFSRKMDPSLKSVDLNRQISQAADMLSRVIPRMIEIELDLADDLAPVLGDPGQLEQIILNLGTNARDAMPDGGRLLLATRGVNLDQNFCRFNPGVKPGPHVVLTVADTGHGMDKQTHDLIFEPFFTTKEPGRGTGLGLSMVFGIVQTHGGHITCKSAPGSGTTFQIYLPVAGAPKAAKSPAGPNGAPRHQGSGTILVVDDEPAIRDIACRMLNAAGYDTLAAENGEAALDVFKREMSRIDLVLLDLSMPGMGGVQCLKEIMAIMPTAKVLIASGYSKEGPLQDTLGMGAVGFVPKPFSRDGLLAEVRQAMDA